MQDVYYDFENKLLGVQRGSVEVDRVLLFNNDNFF